MSDTVRVQLLRPGARMPLRASADASGYDLYACIDQEVEVGQEPTIVPTGIAIEVPSGLDAQIRPRSGLARKGVLCPLGTLDADYRGELIVTLYAIAPNIHHLVKNGDRIAQLVITKRADVQFEAAVELSITVRGEKGHGSTGR